MQGWNAQTIGGGFCGQTWWISSEPGKIYKGLLKAEAIDFEATLLMALSYNKSVQTISKLSGLVEMAPSFAPYLPSLLLFHSLC